MSASARSVHAMMFGEDAREHAKAAAKVRANATPDGKAKSRMTPAEQAALARQVQQRQNTAAQQSHMLKGVLSAQSAQARLQAPAPAPAATPAPKPALIPMPAPRPVVAASSSHKKKKGGRSVTLDESAVEFSSEFDDTRMVPASSKKRKAASAAPPAATVPAPTAESASEEPAAGDVAAQAASLKKSKHRNFRAAPSSDAGAAAATAAGPSGAAATPADAFAPPTRPLSKSERKKLEKIAAAKLKKAERAQTLALLHASQMTPEQHRLMVSTTKLGQKATVKQQRRRQMIEQQAGIAPVTEGEQAAGTGAARSAPMAKSSRPLSSNPALDFFASTISPHIHPPKAKTGRGSQVKRVTPGESVTFADDFGSFRSSAMTTLRTKSSEGGDDDGGLGRGYVAGYIRTGKNSMQELERQERERKEAEEEEEEDDEEGEDEEEEDGEDDENEDDENEDDDDDDDDEEEVLPASNIYTVAFDVQPIRANKKKRRRVVMLLPGQTNDGEEEEKQEEQQTKEEGDEKEDEGQEEEKDEEQDEGEAEEDEPAEEEVEAQPEPSKKKRKQADAAAPAQPADASAGVAGASTEDASDSAPRLSRKAAKAANASVAIAKTFEAGKKFSRVKQDGPSALYAQMVAARAEQGGTSMAYPGTETLAHFRVSNNDLYLGDTETGKPVDKGKKKSKAAYEAAANADPTARLRPEHRMPTLRQTPSGHIIVEVHRTEAIQAARMALPICSQEQEVMEAITENDVLILSGETGSGKTTQVPQFLFEAGYGLLAANKPGLIGITEPRRVAAMATAKRVAEELNVWNPEESKKMAKMAEQKKARAAAKGAAAAATDAPTTVLGGTSGEDAADVVDMTLVSYQVRYTSLSTPNTRIKFMTDGILLREIQASFLLPGYSAILVDEAHERGINTDILIGLLSKIVPLRNQMARKFLAEKERRESLAVAAGRKKEEADLSDLTPIYPLKLIIMSATLRLHDFTQNTRLFPSPPPVLSVTARQYPVTVHWARTTPLGRDYLPAALKMLVKMHAKLPQASGTEGNAGGILVFLTGKEEIEAMVRQVAELFDEKRKREEARKIRLTDALEEAKEGEEGAAAVTSTVATGTKRGKATFKSAPAPAAAAPAYDPDDPSDPVFDIPMSDDEDESDRFATDGMDAKMGEGEEAAMDATAGKEGDLEEEGGGKGKMDPAVLAQQLRDLVDSATNPVHVLPLYSLLPTHEQMRIFQAPPSPSHRLIVLSTNVAETSLTIPGIRYVLDCGREKSRVYDRVTGTSQYVVQWISQASAAQRSGRSGRVGPGHAYRLYSSSAFDTQFAQFAPPEILRNPLESTILQMKSMRIPDLARFPFPTPPEPASLRLALRTLQLLGALESGGQQEVTELGRLLSAFPVAPRFGKMLVLACQMPSSASSSAAASAESASLLSYAIRIVATLSVEQMFAVPDFSKDDEEKEGEDDEAGSGAEEEDEEMGDAAAAGEEPAAGKNKRTRVDLDAVKAREKARSKASRKKEAKKAMQKAYNESQARWRHPQSDVLTMLRALGGYEYALSTGAPPAHSASLTPREAKAAFQARQLHAHRALAFMHANFMRVKAIEEILALKKQLEKIAREVLQYNIGLEAAEQEGKEEGVKQFDPATNGADAGEEASAQEASATSKALTTTTPAGSAVTTATLPPSHPLMHLLRSLQSQVPLPPPSPSQESLLLQLLCAGFIDHVARRMSPERKAALIEDFKQDADVSMAQHERGLNLAGAYEVLSTREAVFIHPSSQLFPRDCQPEFLIYGELVRTSKLYMRHCTALPHLAWLERFGAHLVTYSAPIQTNPSPVYDGAKDEVLAYRDVHFGPERWQLPRSTSPMPAGSVDRAKHFLRLLLSGAVLPSLKRFVPFLLFKPASLTGSDVVAQINKSLSAVLTPFVRERIDSRAKLEAQWKKEPQWFKKEYLSWVQPSQHTAINAMWPPVEKKQGKGK